MMPDIIEVFRVAALKMETAKSSETFVSYRNTTRCVLCDFPSVVVVLDVNSLQIQIHV